MGDPRRRNDYTTGTFGQITGRPRARWPSFPSLLVLGRSQARKLPDTLSRLGIAGGAVYDALVVLAAKEHGTPLATRDSRARGTYEAVGVQVVVVAPT